MEVAILTRSAQPSPYLSPPNLANCSLSLARASVKLRSDISSVVKVLPHQDPQGPQVSPQFYSISMLEEELSRLFSCSRIKHDCHYCAMEIYGSLILEIGSGCFRQPSTLGTASPILITKSGTISWSTMESAEWLSNFQPHL